MPNSTPFKRVAREIVQHAQIHSILHILPTSNAIRRGFRRKLTYLVLLFAGRIPIALKNVVSVFGAQF